MVFVLTFELLYLGTENHEWVPKNSLVTPQVNFNENHWRVSNSYLQALFSTATYSATELIDKIFIRTINADSYGDLGPDWYQDPDADQLAACTDAGPVSQVNQVWIQVQWRHFLWQVHLRCSHKSRYGEFLV